jgi:hypothetical protein
VTDESWVARPAPYQPAVPTGRFHSELRAGDADRDRTIDVLRAGYAEGRLTKEEFEERVDLAQNGRTYADLLALTRDLPTGPMPGAPYPPMPPSPYPVQRRLTNGTAIAAMICGLFAIPSIGITAIPAVILGNAAKEEIDRSGQDGKGMAVVGQVLGWAAIVLYSLALITVMLVVARHSAGTVPSGPSGP